jgi:PadR family transcriptional regulator, regulatory protein PadR
MSGRRHPRGQDPPPSALAHQGSLYPALHRLELRRFLAATWKMSDTGRDAKFYRLTSKGRAQLKLETASWERLTEAIRQIIRTAEGGAL